jgi:hypothetical protein
MAAEPAVYSNGVLSDASEHIEWFDSREGNRLADVLAISHAIASGRSLEDVALLYGDQDALPALCSVIARSSSSSSASRPNVPS